MKFFLLLIFAVASVAAGWISHPAFYRTLEERRAQPAVADAPSAPAVPPATSTSAAPDDSTAGESNRASQAFETLKGKSGEQQATAMPVASSEPPAPGSEAPAGPVDEVDARYPLPTFRAIEEITRDWSMVPARAFPRTVKLKTPVTFESGGGKTVLAAGAEALAVGMTRGFLVLMRSKSDTARAMAPLANTDLKETLTVLYDKYKESKTNQVLKQRERVRGLQKNPVAANGSGSRPEQQEDGVIPLMLASLKRGDLKEVTPESIIQWGTLQIEQIDGEPCWTGTLQCNVENPIFGPTPTEVMAVIRNGRITKWLYTGSREPVQ